MRPGDSAGDIFGVSGSQIGRVVFGVAGVFTGVTAVFTVGCGGFGWIPGQPAGGFDDVGHLGVNQDCTGITAGLRSIPRGVRGTWSWRWSDWGYRRYADR